MKKIITFPLALCMLTFASFASAESSTEMENDHPCMKDAETLHCMSMSKEEVVKCLEKPENKDKLSEGCAAKISKAEKAMGESK
jgi:hypothetical protein